MFVKVYQYHIQTDKVSKYLSIQKKASDIYRKHLNVNTVYLQSKDDNTKWMEISTYRNEVEYNKTITLINEEEEIIRLYAEFQSLIVSGEEISEENYIEQNVKAASL
ncbi:hypothetical protein B4U37_14455 [Sutcliffiella horikoshii]|uniref:ABM domain-containing protein n=2 Tax=Sutcliffiella horikoshii TaxID=79883 RepID=A0ABM6KKZ3_9BACI|nr:hypothetical protein B4U37_14455 [Sutcliffiella horikoshii]